MAKFIYVGPNKRLVWGMSCKAYTVRRSGTHVISFHGPVATSSKLSQRLRWCGHGPVRYVWRCRSVSSAKKRLKRQVERKLATGYRQLLGRVRILPKLRGR